MEKELKRLRRIIIWVSALLIIVLLSIVAFFSAQLAQMRNTVYVAQAKMAEPIKGLDGADGLSIVGPQGIQGAQGLPGQNAISTQTTTIVQQPIYTNVPTPGPQGEQGEKGDTGVPGTSGREVELGQEDGKTVWRYKGDLRWSKLTEVTDTLLGASN